MPRALSLHGAGPARLHGRSHGSLRCLSAACGASSPGSEGGAKSFPEIQSPVVHAIAIASHHTLHASLIPQHRASAGEEKRSRWRGQSSVWSGRCPFAKISDSVAASQLGRPAPPRRRALGPGLKARHSRPQAGRANCSTHGSRSVNIHEHFFVKQKRHPRRRFEQRRPTQDPYASPQLGRLASPQQGGRQQPPTSVTSSRLSSKHLVPGNLGAPGMRARDSIGAGRAELWAASMTVGSLGRV